MYLSHIQIYPGIAINGQPHVTSTVDTFFQPQTNKNSPLGIIIDAGWKNLWKKPTFHRNSTSFVDVRLVVLIGEL
jgi:hypothetical protein